MRVSSNASSANIILKKFRNRISTLSRGAVALFPVTVWLTGLFVVAALGLLLSAATPADESLLEMMSRAELRSTSVVQVKARARRVPGMPAADISLGGQLEEIAIYRTEKPSCRWAIITPESAIISGDHNQVTVTGNARSAPEPASCQPHIGFTGCFMWGSTMLGVEECLAAQGRHVLRRESFVDNAGLTKMTLTVSPTTATLAHAAGIQMDATVGWFHPTYTRRYVIDMSTGRLEKVTVFTNLPMGQVLLFETLEITYKEAVQVDSLG
jgi:hypothetical protein